ncbi:T9SS type A sorting domain-containing protein [Luteibaculum oceani]|uniref:T9SS type A sorting domain-containing protein n=1 Tax=Luteibaculum oceani TaxID=1294296 RepID=A0A5C6VEF3_9FLAO|nr:T9SS type A sorting domain-containing protein [Luteibaculum oceani]TXC81488.1 T9SS type A sorting domain-containing protein [Luteibaculum oceani]
MKYLLAAIAILVQLLAFSQNYNLRQFESLKEVEVNNIINTGEDILYAATEGGVYKSDNGGLDWVLYNTGLSQVNDDRWRVTNGIQELYNTPDGIFLITNYHALFKEVNGSWEHVLANYEVYDLAFYNGEMYISGAEIEDSYFRVFYKVKDLNSEPEFLRTFGYDNFMKAEPLTALSDGIILGEPGGVILYDGEGFTKLNSEENFIIPHNIYGTSSSDFYVVHKPLFLFYLRDNLYHYDGTELKLTSPKVSIPFYVHHLFTNGEDVYISGYEGTEFTSIPRVLKLVEVLGSDQWIETSGYADGVTPIFKGMVSFGVSNYLYFTQNGIWFSASNLGGTTQRRESGIYNGTVEELAHTQDEIYLLRNGKVKGFNQETEDEITSIPPEENSGFRGLGMAENYVWCHKIDWGDDYLGLYRRSDSMDWTLNEYEFDLFMVPPLGSSEGKVDFMGMHNGEVVWDILTVNLSSGDTAREPWLHSDSSFVRKVVRVNGTKFTVNVFSSYDKDNPNGQFYLDDNWWSINVQNKEGQWIEYMPDRNDWYFDWDYLIALEKTSEGEVFLVFSDKDYFEYNSLDKKTVIKKYDFETDRFEDYLVWDELRDDLRYKDGLWTCRMEGVEMFSYDLINWFKRNFDGLPEAAEVEFLKRIGNRVYCSTKGNGLFTQDLSTSVPDLILANSLEVFPNPSKGNLSFKTESAIDNYRIINISGQTVDVGNINKVTDQHRLDLNHLERGVYILQLLGKNEVKYSSKIILN